MNDKFSKLITLLQTSLKEKTEEKDNILNRKRSVISKLGTLRCRSLENETIANLLETDLKKYNRYFLNLVESISKICFYGIVEIVDIGFLVFIIFEAFKIFFGNPFDLFFLAYSFFISLGTTIFCYKTFKRFVSIQKSYIRDIQEGKRLRKKYKSSKDIQTELELVEAEIAKLSSEYTELKNEKKLLKDALDVISSEIVELKRRLSIASGAFIQSSLKVQSPDIEEALDEEYDKSHIEQQVGSVDEIRIIGFHPKKSDNQ